MLSGTASPPALLSTMRVAAMSPFMSTPKLQAVPVEPPLTSMVREPRQLSLERVEVLRGLSILTVSRMAQEQQTSKSQAMSAISILETSEARLVISPSMKAEFSAVRERSHGMARLHFPADLKSKGTIPSGKAVRLSALPVLREMVKSTLMSTFRMVI